MTRYKESQRNLAAAQQLAALRADHRAYNSGEHINAAADAALTTGRAPQTREYSAGRQALRANTVLVDYEVIDARYAAAIDSRQAPVPETYVDYQNSNYRPPAYAGPQPGQVS